MTFPYESFRKGQRESIERIRKYLGKVIVLKAPTGFGKTVVSILAHRDAERVLYVVRTRNEMSPVIKELRKIGESFTVIFSGRRMCPLLTGKPGKQGGVRAEDFWINCRVLRSRGLCYHYQRLSEVSEDDIASIVWGSGNDPHVIAKSLTNKLGVCPFFALTKLIKLCRYVIATYPYLFREEVFRTAFTDVSLEEFYVIIDEAHIILNPQALYEEELTERDVDEAMKEVRNYSVGEEVWNYLRNVKEVFELIRHDRLRRVRKDLVYPGEGTLQIIEDAIIDIRLKKLREMLSDPSQVMSISTKLSKVAKFLTYASYDGFNVYGCLGTSGSKVLKVIPTSYEPVRERLSIVKGVLLMSGTMPPKEVVDYVLSLDTHYIDVEEEYGKVFPEYNKFKAVFTGVTSSYRYRSADMFLKYSRLVEEVVRASPSGVVLVIYPSYPFMHSVTENVILNDAEQIVEGKSTTIEEVVSTVSRGGKVVIHAVAGGKLSEGIELVDPSAHRSLIKVVLVAGVPYPQPDDYIDDLRENLRRHLPNQVASELVMDVPATIKVLQAVGRAVRSEHDRAFIILADRRFLSPRLRRLLGITYDLICSSSAVLVNYLRKFLEGRL